jgi:hypothetical protein
MKYEKVAAYVRDNPGERVPDIARQLNIRADTLNSALRNGLVPGVSPVPSDLPGDKARVLYPEDRTYSDDPPPDWPSEQGESRLDALLREYAELSSAVHAAQERMEAIKEEIKSCA